MRKETLKYPKNNQLKIAMRQMRARLLFITPPGLKGFLFALWVILVKLFVTIASYVTGRVVFKKYVYLIASKFSEMQLLPFYYAEREMYDFNGIFFPKPTVEGDVCELLAVVKDVLYVYMFNNDDYNWKYVDKLDKKLIEGVYCYSKPECGCEILVSAGDTVLDIGAWLGDFSAYACKRGATAYAFEPAPSNRNLLEKTVMYNSGNSRGGGIIVVPYAAGRENKTMEFVEHLDFPAASGLLTNDSKQESPQKKIKVDFVRLDDWVNTNGITKVDFIKADIEGFERDMLLGATKILQEHKPILSLCTYHKPDDPEVMSRIILDANPDYKIIYRNMKLFAYVPR